MIDPMAAVVSDHPQQTRLDLRVGDQRYIGRKLWVDDEIITLQSGNGPDTATVKVRAESVDAVIVFDHPRG